MVNCDITIIPFQSLKEKRQAGQPPHQNGRHVFDDGYRYGIVHYSGEDSEVSRYGQVEFGYFGVCKNIPRVQSSVQ